MTTSKTKHELQIRLVFFQEGQRWVAQCVEYNINASGRSVAEAQNEFSWAFIAALVVRAERGLLDPEDPTACLPKGRPQYEDIFNQAQRLAEGASFAIPPGVDIPAAHVILAVHADRGVCLN